MVYITKDLDKNDTQTIIILPFLHEKRIYLNRIKSNTFYFYSSIDTPIEEIERYNKDIELEYGNNQSAQNKMFNQSLRRKSTMMMKNC